jgi:ribosomal protein L11 methylase PrmA
LGKAWPALDIHVPNCDPQLVELVLAELDDFQPTAIQEPDETSRLRAFFTSTESRDAAARALAASFGTHLFVEILSVEDEDWAARSQAQLRAIAVGRIVIAPPWDLGSDPRTVRGSDPELALRSSLLAFLGSGGVGGSDPITIVIRPSMGFGTGHHATTRLMLRAVQQLQIANQTVLDVGCGSGILAIAAIKLGARSAVGIDIDPDALANATENAALNQIGDRVRFEESDFRTMSARADVVMANLTGALLERSAATFGALVTPGGRLIVSGFMQTEADAVASALNTVADQDSIAQEEEWMCAIYRSRQT